MNNTSESTSVIADFLTQFGAADWFIQMLDRVGWPALMFIVVLSILVFVHELGHYLAARSAGVRVKTFSIGFGPELFGFDDSHGTRWKVSLVPLGGYVDMFGFEGKSEDYRKKDRAEAFCAKSVWARMWVVFAGPLANFLFAFVALAILFVAAGEQKMMAKVGDVLPDMPAATAGLQKDDVILAVNGQNVDDWDSMRKAISENLDSAVQLQVQRGAQVLPLTMRTQSEDYTNELGDKKRVGRIGIAPNYETYTVPHPPVQAIVLAAERTWFYTSLTFTVITRMITGQVATDQIGGPIMIAEVAGQAAAVGLYPLIMFMVAISINLGLINLFPIPVLDGGHLVFMTIEAIKGSPLSEAAQEVGFRVGLAAIACLMMFAFYNDIARIVGRMMG